MGCISWASWMRFGSLGAYLETRRMTKPIGQVAACGDLPRCWVGLSATERAFVHTYLALACWFRVLRLVPRFPAGNGYSASELACLTTQGVGGRATSPKGSSLPGPRALTGISSGIPRRLSRSATDWLSRLLDVRDARGSRCLGAAFAGRRRGPPQNGQWGWRACSNSRLAIVVRLPQSRQMRGRGWLFLGRSRGCRSTSRQVGLRRFFRLIPAPPRRPGGLWILGRGRCRSRTILA